MLIPLNKQRLLEVTKRILSFDDLNFVIDVENDREIPLKVGKYNFYEAFKGIFNLIDNAALAGLPTNTLAIDELIYRTAALMLLPVETLNKINIDSKNKYEGSGVKELNDAIDNYLTQKENTKKSDMEILAHFDLDRLNALAYKLKKETFISILNNLNNIDRTVFIENFKVGDMKRYGLDYESLKALNPKLVYCSITGFGQTGPYKDRAGYDYAVQGIGGLMSITGERDDLGGGPQKVGVAVADLFTGLYSCIGILAALRHAQNTGEGQYVDMALLDTQVAMLANLGANYLTDGQFSGKIPGRMGNAHQNIVPYQVFEVAPTPSGERDYIILAVGNDRQFAKFCEVANQDWHQDPRFTLNQDRVRHRDILVPLLQTTLLTRTKSVWLEALEQAKVPCGAINNFAEVFNDPQVRAREMVQTWTHPYSDQLELVASPLKLSRTPVQQKLAPPLLGQHTREVLSQVLQMSESEIAALQADQVI